jgi:hypothetical protein
MYNYKLDFRIIDQETRKDIQANGLKSENKYSFDEWKDIINEAIKSISNEDIKYVTTDFILRKIIELHDDFSFIDWESSVVLEMEERGEI